MKSEQKKMTFETIGDIIEFLTNVQKEDGLAQIKKLDFECWSVNKIKSFNVEYFSADDFNFLKNQ